MEEAQIAFTGATNTMVSELDAAYTAFEESVDASFEAAGEDADTFRDTVAEDISGSDGVVA